MTGLMSHDGYDDEAIGLDSSNCCFQQDGQQYQALNDRSKLDDSVLESLSQLLGPRFGQDDNRRAAVAQH